MTIPSTERSKTRENRHKKTASLYHIRQWPFWIIAALLWSMVKLFSYPQLMKIGKIVGLLAYYFSRYQRNIAKVNIQKCFPDIALTQQNILLRSCFVDMGKGLFESALSWWGSDEVLEKLTHISGLEYITAALKKKKGLLIFLPHFFSLYLCGRLANLKHPFGVMFLPPKNPVFRWINYSYLKRSYAFAVTRHDARGLIKALKNNQALFYTPDTDPGKRYGEFVPFFGVPAKTLTAVARFVQLTKCAVMPVNYFRREDETGYEIHFQPALENYPSGDLLKDAEVINQTIEKIIAAHPNQYIWQYKRFKTRPPGEKDFYGK